METSVQRITSSLESVGKLTLFVLGILLGLGTLIVNLHLATLGLSDFTALRPRFVLVGLAYLIYVGIPPGYCVALLWVASLVRQQHSFVITGIAVASAGAILVPLIAGLLFSTLPYVIVPEGGGFRPTLNFYLLYRNYNVILIQVLLICLPACILLLRRIRHPVPWKVVSRIPDPLLIGLVVLGSVGISYYYSVITYVNIAKAAGGGHPAIVWMSIEPEVAGTLGPSQFPAGSFPGHEGMTGPFLLWHESESRVYVEHVRGSSAVYAIPQDRVAVLKYVRGYVYAHSIGFSTSRLEIRLLE